MSSLDKKRQILQKLEELTDEIEDEFFDIFVNELESDLENIVFEIRSMIQFLELGLIRSQNDDIPL